MVRATTARSGPHCLRAVVSLAAILMAVSLAGCASPGAPAASGSGFNAGEARQAALLAVVTAGDLDTLVRIDVDSHAITRLAVLGENKPIAEGGSFYSQAPESTVLFDSTRPKPIVWTWAVEAGTVVRELDVATGELHAIDASGAGVLPFLIDGKLAWATERFAAKPRLISADGTFEIDLPGPPSIIVGGPGQGRISAVVNVGDPNSGVSDERIVIVDVAESTVTELPTGRFHIGGLWADDSTLVASLSVRIMPTPDDPENSALDDRVLTWTFDAGGSNPEAVAGLVAGPTLRGSSYPGRVAGGNGWIAVETGYFDHSQVEVHELVANHQPQIFELEQDMSSPAMSVSGTTLVVLQSSRVTFIDLETGKVTPVALGGSTQTIWVGR